MKELIPVMERARELIEKPEQWYQGTIYVYLDPEADFVEKYYLNSPHHAKCYLDDCGDPREGFCMCATGAVRLAVHLYPHNPKDMADYEMVDCLLRCLADVLKDPECAGFVPAPKPNKYNLSYLGACEAFNDHPNTSHGDVMLWFKQAIEKMEAANE